MVALMNAVITTILPLYGRGQLIADGTHQVGSPEPLHPWTSAWSFRSGRTTATRQRQRDNWPQCHVLNKHEARYGRTGKSVRSSGYAYARIVHARVVVVVCARKGHGLLGEEAVSNSGDEWLEFGSANCHGQAECDDLMPDGIILWGVLCWRRYGDYQFILHCRVDMLISCAARREEKRHALTPCLPHPTCCQPDQF